MSEITSIAAWNKRGLEDVRELLHRATRQLSAWHEWYGRHQCTHIPPAGDVALQENIAEVLRG